MVPSSPRVVQDSLLGAFLGLQRPLKRSSWAYFGLSWAYLGPSQPRLEHNSAHLGAFLGHPGAILGLSWTILGLSWAVLALAWAYFVPREPKNAQDEHLGTV